MVLEGDGIFLLTSSGVVQAIDAESGNTRWVYQFGERAAVGQGPSANERFVALTRAGHLFVVDRATGEPVFDHRLAQIGSAPPTLDGGLCFVPQFNGLLTTFNLDEPLKEPWRIRATGQIDAHPLATPEHIIFVTRDGLVYCSTKPKKKLLFQMRAGGAIAATPGYYAPYLYVGSRDGFVYAVHEATGHVLWRFSAGSPVMQTPVAIGDRVYVVPEDGGMYSLARDTGLEQWYAPQVRSWVAASPSRSPAKGPGGKPTVAFDGQKPARLYVQDTHGNLRVLDAASGTLVDSLELESTSRMLVNLQNDRLYFYTERGLLQCLHEQGVKTPVSCVPPPAPSDAEGAKKRASERAPAVEEEPADEMPADETEETRPRRDAGSVFEEEEP